MELVEINRAKENRIPFSGTIKCPCNVKCTRRYVQPPRVQSFAPQRLYKPPTERFDNNTTYIRSFLSNEGTKHCRSQPVKPKPAIETLPGKLSDETTNKLSYKPIWNITRQKSILPKQRSMIGPGRIDDVTTVRQDYAPKSITRPEMILPCSNIRLSKGDVEDKTTAKLSYVHPGPMQPITNFKPIRTYRPPTQPILDCTTQKLSYQPFCVLEKEDYPWKHKPKYKPSDEKMYNKTTYTESYPKNDEPRVEKPFLPIGSVIFPHGEQFRDKTIYKESYLSCAPDRVELILPSNSLSVPDGEMSADTTTKLSYQAVRCEKRSPILPKAKRTIIPDGPMESETTNRREFIPKAGSRPDPVVPLNNIKSSEAPIEGGTTTKLSYVKPETEDRVQSFKPLHQYCRSSAKIESDTVSKLSYQAWSVGPKEKIPWGRKGEYQRPADPMSADTIYHMSYPVPGHYEECIPEECNCS